MFKTANTYDPKAAKEELKERDQQARDELEGKKTYLHRLQDGHNVFWWLPSFSNKNSEPWADMLVHYKPFHICGRRAPQEQENGEFRLDNRFANCARCKEAWALYEPYTEMDSNDPVRLRAKTNFKKDMPSHQVGIQVINLTAFFDYDNVLEEITPNQRMIAQWIEPYVQIARACLEGDEPVIPEDMPKEMAEQAQASVGLLRLNKTAGVDLRRAYRKQAAKDARAKLDPPLHNVDHRLLTIVRSDGDNTFVVNGQKRRSSKYSSTIAVLEDGWQCPDSLKLMAIENESLLKDIHNLGIYDGTVTLEEKALSMANLSDDEILNYLRSAGHSFVAEDDEEEEEATHVPSSETPSDNPDDFEAPTLLTSGNKAGIQALRERLGK